MRTPQHKPQSAPSLLGVAKRCVLLAVVCTVLMSPASLQADALLDTHHENAPQGALWSTHCSELMSWSNATAIGVDTEAAPALANNNAPRWCNGDKLPICAPDHRGTTQMRDAHSRAPALSIATATVPRALSTTTTEPCVGSLGPACAHVRNLERPPTAVCPQAVV